MACTQFMNIIVHSVENVNYRVHLQYELTTLGLDDFLETLKDNESERLITQVLCHSSMECCSFKVVIPLSLRRQLHGPMDDIWLTYHFSILPFNKCR